MSRSPDVVLVPYGLAPGRVRGWRGGAYAVPTTYVDAVRRAGGHVTLVLPGDARTPSDVLNRSDALLLVGGGDIEPWRYGQEPHGAIVGVEPDRDALEIELLLEAARLDVPTLCICRGMQVMNVAFGGTLVQHIPDDERLAPHGAPGGPDRVVHEVTTAPGSRVAQATGGLPLASSSHHHQGVERLGHDLVPTGWTTDGLVEAIERHDNTWFLGVQWHPEDTAADDPAQQGLFDRMVLEARR